MSYYIVNAKIHIFFEKRHPKSTLLLFSTRFQANIFSQIKRIWLPSLCVVAKI